MTTLTSLVYPKVEAALKNKNNENEFKRVVGRYIDVNNRALTSIGPSSRPMFNPSDEEPLYRMSHMTGLEVRKHIRENKYIKSQWQIMNNPFNTVISMFIRYGIISKNKNLQEVALTYMALSMYPSLHNKYYEFEPNENIMAYTISNLSYKYKIRNTGNLLIAMQETMYTCLEHHVDDLVKGTDKGLVDFVMDVKTRLNSMMRNIANEFYDNHKSGKYLNTDGDSFEEEKYHEADSNIYAVNRYTNDVTIKMTSQMVNDHTVTIAAKSCKVSVNELRNYILAITNKKEKKEMHDLIEAIITSYLLSPGVTSKDMKDNNKFLEHALNLYKKSNTTDKNVIRIKTILDEWMEDVGVYKKTQRAATINDFRKSIYLYFVFSITKIV